MYLVIIKKDFNPKKNMHLNYQSLKSYLYYFTN